jgi:integron integrase
MNKPPKKLLHQVRDRLRLKHYSIRTERSYTNWSKRYILFHNKKHPKDMGEREIEQFLTHLAVEQKVAQSTQNQALNAIIFLYREVLDIELNDPINAIRAKRPQRLPAVLTQAEVKKLLNAMSGTPRIMAMLLYGAGLRLVECIRLRIKDIDFEKNQIIVRDGKVAKDRVTILPDNVRGELAVHLDWVETLHQDDLSKGFGSVYLPYAFERKYKSAHRKWTWQYVFPSKCLSKDPRSNRVRRHHMHPNTLQKAVKQAAARAKITKQATCHTLRHIFCHASIGKWI